MISGEDRILQITRGFQASRILLTAFELGIFTALGNSAKGSIEVAEIVGGDPRATDRLMNALVALGLLEKEGESFNNAPDTAELLVPDSPGYIGGGLGHMINLWDSWSTLTDAVRAGTSVLRREGAQRKDWVTPFIAAMEYNAARLAPQVIPSIDLNGVKRLLDIGGGSGAYSIAFCRHKPDLEAVIFDLPDVVPLTKKYIEMAGMSNRISTVSGDFNVNDLPTGFDLVFLSQILHSNSPMECQELIQKCYNALNPGGQVVIQEFILSEDRTAPPHAAFFALNMLVGTTAGDAFTESEVSEWLREAGFSDIQRVDPESTGTTLIMATRR